MSFPNLPPLPYFQVIAVPIENLIPALIEESAQTIAFVFQRYLLSASFAASPEGMNFLQTVEPGLYAKVARIGEISMPAFTAIFLRVHQIVSQTNPLLFSASLPILPQPLPASLATAIPSTPEQAAPNPPSAADSEMADASRKRGRDAASSSDPNPDLVGSASTPSAPKKPRIEIPSVGIPLQRLIALGDPKRGAYATLSPKELEFKKAYLRQDLVTYLESPPQSKNIERTEDLLALDEKGLELLQEWLAAIPPEKTSDSLASLVRRLGYPYQQPPKLSSGERFAELGKAERDTYAGLSSKELSLKKQELAANLRGRLDVLNKSAPLNLRSARDLLNLKDSKCQEILKQLSAMTPKRKAGAYLTQLFSYYAASRKKAQTVS